MKIPRPKPHNPMPPPAQAHRDARREADRKACRGDELRDYMAGDREADPTPLPAPRKKATRRKKAAGTINKSAPDETL